MNEQKRTTWYWSAVKRSKGPHKYLESNGAGARQINGSGDRTCVQYNTWRLLLTSEANLYKVLFSRELLLFDCCELLRSVDFCDVIPAMPFEELKSASDSVCLSLGVDNGTFTPARCHGKCV